MRTAARATGVVSLAGLAVAAALGTSSARPSTRLPAFFAATLATGQSNGPLEIRASKTGQLLDQVGALAAPAALAAIDSRTLVLAAPRAAGCATRLYRIRIDQRGRVGARSAFGPTLPGIVWSVAASADGRIVGLAISGCAKGDPGFLEVLDAYTGRVRRWSNINLGGVSFGDIALEGSLSMSADGRVLLFADDAIARPPYGHIAAQEVRSLATDAPPGTVTARSTLLLRRHGVTPAFTAATVAPNAKRFYLCVQTQTTAKILAYKAGNHAPDARIATFAHGNASRADCSAMALDRGGRFLLVPYLLAFPARHGQAAQHVATVDTVTHARTTFTLRIPAPNGGWLPAGIHPAW